METDTNEYCEKQRHSHLCTKSPNSRLTVELAGLLHEERTTQLPLPFEELLQCLRLVLGAGRGRGDGEDVSSGSRSSRSRRRQLK
jgi:hypothetical protein